MDIDQMQRLTEEVNFLRENTVSESSKTAYIGSTLRFLNWLYENDRDLLTNEFISHVQVNNQFSKQAAKEFLKQRVHHPIIFQQLTSMRFMRFIVSLRTSAGNKPSNSSSASHRSALYNLVRTIKLIPRVSSCKCKQCMQGCSDPILMQQLMDRIESAPLKASRVLLQLPWNYSIQAIRRLFLNAKFLRSMKISKSQDYLIMLKRILNQFIRNIASGTNISVIWKIQKASLLEFKK
jgi:hypothetical protein